LRFNLVKLATPLALSAIVPMLKPQVKFTFPVGGTDPEVVTVAVQVTFCPYTDGFRLEKSVVWVTDLVVELLPAVAPVKYWLRNWHPQDS